MPYPSWTDGPLWTTVAATTDCPEYAVYTGDVTRSDLDDRDYRLIRLGNGILGVLVHDENADKAAASLHVAAGHLQDPVGLISTSPKYVELIFMTTGRCTRSRAFLRAYDHEGR